MKLHSLIAACALFLGAILLCCTGALLHNSALTFVFAILAVLFAIPLLSHWWSWFVQGPDQMTGQSNQIKENDHENP